MKYKLEVKHEAFLDIKEAYLYYESRKKGLGKRFIETLEIYIDRIQKYPEHYQIKRNPYREVFIKDFPYLIIFEIENKSVIVYAVFNTWRNPGSKPSKK
ncbi:type II toxin-antitoxin system RelE/ParE family toxin [Flavobacterium sp. MAHUQ-51]|uniref:type II toxin-antitoxin system RelE/ParE family toxin n=1 Tax=Flavobacterium sp. GCM10022190 TaxID=3252639 RepID=UPI00360CA6C1